MHKLSLMILVGTFFIGTANVAADDKATIRALELEVQELTKELNNVRMQYTTLRTRLENVRSILGGNDIVNAGNGQELDAQACSTSLSNLKQTQTKLKSLGYKDEHPDLRLVITNIKKRTLECAEIKEAKSSEG